MESVCREFIVICEEVSNDDFFPLKASLGYRDLLNVSFDDSTWVKFLDDLQLLGIQSYQKSLGIRQKLTKSLSPEALEAIDHEMFF